MPTNSRFSAANLMYRGLACSVPGCTRTRKTISPYCAYHSKRYNGRGHPTQPSILPRDYDVELHQVNTLVLNNMKHPGIQAGIEFFHAWLTYADTGEKRVPQRALMKAVLESGVTPAALLSEVAAIVLLSHLRPDKLIQGKPTLYAYARAIIRHSGQLQTAVSPSSGAKRRKPVSGGVVKEIGTYIHDNLNPLLLNLANTAEDREKQAKDAMNSFYRPIPY